MKRVIYCFFITVVCLALICGCQPTPPKRESLFASPFCAEITGEREGLRFSAKLVGEGREGTISIEYLTPDALTKVSVKARLGADGSLGDRVELARGGMAIELPRTAADGLLLPIQVLLLHAKEDAATVQRTAEGYQFTFADGTTLALTPSGIPQSVISPNLSYQIVWWEEKIGDSHG